MNSKITPENFDRHEFIDETYGTLEILKIYPFGLLVFNKSHHKENLISILSDYASVAEHTRKGWNSYPGKFKYIMQAPETVIVDLSEISQNVSRDPVDILTFYNILLKISLENELKEITSSMKGLEVLVVNGLSSLLEVRIVGTDQRVYEIPKIIFEKYKGSDLWNQEFKKTKNKIKTHRTLKVFNIDLAESSSITREYFAATKRKYSIFPDVKLSTQVSIGYWNDIPKCDMYLFVPKSGLKYALGFIEDTQSYKNICLWECHLSLDRTKELIIDFPRNANNKKVLIADRSYSSNTLDYLEDKILENNCIPVKLALFPKSKRAITHSDYVIFLDKVIKSSEISFESKWQENLFLKIING